MVRLDDKIKSKNIQLRKVKIIDNVYQLVTVYEALTHMLDINRFDPLRFTGNHTLGTGTLSIGGVNEVWKLTNGFYKCIKKIKPPLIRRLSNERT